MFHWGYDYRDHREGSGQFTCPRCLASTGYGIYGVYCHYHFNFAIIPLLWKKERVGEKVKCDACGADLPVTVLATDAPAVRATPDACPRGGAGIHQNLGNVVELTDAAAREIIRRLFSGKFGRDTVARIRPAESPRSGYRVALDYALADGSDWLGESKGIGIVVARSEAASLLGRTLDFRDGIFCDGDKEATSRISRD